VDKIDKENEPFEWESEQSLAFMTMVTAVMTSLGLHHFNQETEVVIKTDASDYVSAGVLPLRNDRKVYIRG